MTFCSLSEAWGQGPDGIENIKYQAVHYKDSNIYNHSGKQVFNDKKSQEVERVQNMSRTQERLPQHSGPPNRYSEKVKSVTLNYDDNNSVSIDETEIPFSKKNSELPISEYSKLYKSKNHYNSKESFPRHRIYDKPKCLNRKKQPDQDLNDTIDRIIKNKNSNDTDTYSTDNKSDSSAYTNITVQSSVDYKQSVSEPSIDYKSPRPINGKLKELERKYRNKNNIIKYLISQNEKLTKLLKKKSTSSRSSGIFSQWDLLIVISLGILMIIILEYVYKIAVSKS